MGLYALHQNKCIQKIFHAIVKKKTKKKQQHTTDSEDFTEM